jgi:hypothetical protein
VVKPLAIVVVVALGIAGGLLTPGVPARAQEFSADIVSSNGDAAASPRLGRLYVKNEKARIETSELPDGFFLVDSVDHVAYFVRPAQRVFMDAKQTTRLTRILVRVDPSDPCRQWDAMAVAAGVTSRGGRWRCERSGEETVDGRTVTVYWAASSDNRRISAWVDPQLKFPLRVRSDDGMTVAELKNVQEGPQAAGLFEMPPNYAKFDPQRLIERIKQSDVWVEPPQ